MAFSFQTWAWSQETASKAALSSAASNVAEQVFVEPMVARVELRLTIGEKEVDVIEKGDLLTVLEERPMKRSG